MSYRRSLESRFKPDRCLSRSIAASLRAHDCLRTTYLLVTVWTPSWSMKAQIYRGYYIPFLNHTFGVARSLEQNARLLFLPSCSYLRLVVVLLLDVSPDQGNFLTRSICTIGEKNHRPAFIVYITTCTARAVYLRTVLQYVYTETLSCGLGALFLPL